MPLRSPLYLDMETLAAQAEYNGGSLPTKTDVVATTTRKRSGEAALQAAGARMGVGAGKDVAFQSSYVLEPKEKATVSKIIDELITDDVITVEPDEDSALSVDDVVEVHGRTRITNASLAGKMMYALRRLMDQGDDPSSIFAQNLSQSAALQRELRDVYLRNELLPVPVLLELSGSPLPQKVYVSLQPDHFINRASVDRIEGELRVLGSIRSLIPGGDEGYLSTEEWLLHDWEYLMRRMAMAKSGDKLHELLGDLPIELPAEDVLTYISGPAVLIDAIALY